MLKSSQKLSLFAVFGLILSVSCRDISAPAPVPGSDLSADWATATYAEAGIDSAALESAINKAKDFGGLRSVAVMRDAKLVREAYFGNGAANNLNDVRSVTKSVIAVLIGIAIAEGHLPGVDATIGTYLADVVQDLPAEKANITIRQLLTMSSGLQWDENPGNDYSLFAQAQNPVAFTLGKPIVATPGSRFIYNSGGTHLLSVILTTATGMSTRDYAKAVLFDKLGIRRVGWQTIGLGHYNGGAGLQLLTTDLARIGVLMLQNGRSGDEQIIPEEWVEQMSSQRQGVGGGYAAMQSLGYGYLWWLDQTNGGDAFLGWGYGGQFLYCVPDKDLVLITTSEWQRNGVTANNQAQRAINLIVEDLLPAVRTLE